MEIFFCLSGRFIYCSVNIFHSYAAFIIKLSNHKLHLNDYVSKPYMTSKLDYKTLVYKLSCKELK